VTQAAAEPAAVNETVEGSPVIIEWGQPQAGAVLGWSTSILDAETGDLIPAVTRAVIAEAHQVVVALLEQLVDSDGRPLAGGAAPHLADGVEATRVFQCKVAEMRVKAAL
jgi:hypothetical protein